MRDYESLFFLTFVIFFQDENLHRCSISADSQIENSGSDDSTDDDNHDVKGNGYHNVESGVDPDTDDDPERVLSGKLSESSGYAGSDLYDYKVLVCVYMHGACTISVSIFSFICETLCIFVGLNLLEVSFFLIYLFYIRNRGTSLI